MSTNMEIRANTTTADSLGCTDGTDLSPVLYVHLHPHVLVHNSTTVYPDFHVDRPQDLSGLLHCRITISTLREDDTLECYPDLSTELQYSWLTVFSIPNLPTELQYSPLTVSRVYKAGKLHHYWMLHDILTMNTYKDLPSHPVYHVTSMG